MGVFMSAPLYESVLPEADASGDECHRGGRPFELWGITDGRGGRVDEAAAMDVAEQARPLCALALRADRRELCPGAECPLWENGECALERLSAEGELYIDGWPEEPVTPTFG
jgi:hypothetical protein